MTGLADDALVEDEDFFALGIDTVGLLLEDFLDLGIVKNSGENENQGGNATRWWWSKVKKEMSPRLILRDADDVTMGTGA